MHRHPAQRAAARPLPHERGLDGAQQWFVGPEAAAQCRAQPLHPPLPLAGPGPGPRRRCRRRHRSFTASTSACPPRARVRRRHGGPLPPTGTPLCEPPSWRRRGLRLLPGRTRVARAPPRAEVRGAAPEVSSAHAHCLGAGGRRGGTGGGRGAERSGASAAMPREIITLQLGQCGNQSERATAVAGPGERAPGGVGMLWGGAVSGAWLDGAGLQENGAGPVDRGAPGPAPVLIPVPVLLPGPSDRASPQSGSSSGSSSAPSTASAPRASWKSSPPRAPTARTSSFTRYRRPPGGAGTPREACCPAPRGARARAGAAGLMHPLHIPCGHRGGWAGADRAGGSGGSAQAPVYSQLRAPACAPGLLVKRCGGGAEARGCGCHR